MTSRLRRWPLRIAAPIACVVTGIGASTQAAGQPAARPDVIRVSYMLFVTSPGKSPDRMPAAGTVIPLSGELITPPAIAAKLTAEFGAGEAELVAAAQFDLDPQREQILPGRLDWFSCALSVAGRADGKVSYRLRLLKPDLTLPDAVFSIERTGRVLVSARYGDEGVFVLLSIAEGPPARRVVPPGVPPSGRSPAPPSASQPRSQVVTRTPIVLPDGSSRPTDDTIVILDVSINEQGIPTSAEAVAGDRKLAQAVADSIMRWRFSAPAGGRTRLLMGFNLRGSVPPDATASRFSPVGQMPSKVRDVRPKYPAEAQRKRIQGQVAASCAVDPEGIVAEATIVEGIDGLNEAALDAVLRWRFTPRPDGGVLTMMTTVNFSLR